MRRLRRSWGRAGSLVRTFDRAMLAVYRKDVPCPKAFLLIVLEEGAGRISLIDTLLRTRIPMIPAAGASDLVLRSSTASSELSNQRLLFSAPKPSTVSGRHTQWRGVLGLDPGAVGTSHETHGSHRQSRCSVPAIEVLSAL